MPAPVTPTKSFQNILSMNWKNSSTYQGKGQAYLYPDLYSFVITLVMQCQAFLFNIFYRFFIFVSISSAASSSSPPPSPSPCYYLVQNFCFLGESFLIIFTINSLVSLFGIPQSIYNVENSLPLLQNLFLFEYIYLDMYAVCVSQSKTVFSNLHYGVEKLQSLRDYAHIQSSFE